MHIRKIAALMLAAVSALIVFTGCSSYTPGKVKDGVYRNSYFTVTTPEGFACFTGKQVENVSCYIVEYANSTARGAQKSFNCEYRQECRDRNTRHKRGQCGRALNG